MNNNENKTAASPETDENLPQAEFEDSAREGKPALLHISRIGAVACAVCVFILIIIGQPPSPALFQRGVVLSGTERVAEATVKKSDMPGPSYFRRAVISDGGKRLTVTDEKSNLVFTRVADSKNRTTFSGAKLVALDAYGNVCVLDFRVAGIGGQCEERVIKFSADGIYLG